jgi:hypothetical protein
MTFHFKSPSAIMNVHRNNKCATMSNEKSLRREKSSKWRQRLQNEADHSPKVFVDALLDTDVLLGKHRDAFNHIGNRTFRTLIQDHWERYNHAAGRGERTVIVVQIFDFLREERQVRFLKRDNAAGRWFIVHDSVAREKVGHAIRDAINFRRHHLRKMTEVPRRNDSVGVNCYGDATSLQKPTRDWAPVTGSPPPLYMKNHTIVPPAIHARSYKRNGDEFMSTNRHAYEVVSKVPHGQSAGFGFVSETMAADRYIVRSDPLINSSALSNCSTHSINRVVSNETPSFEEEAAMMGAFSVWASQTYADATVALNAARNDKGRSMQLHLY